MTGAWAEGSTLLVDGGRTLAHERDVGCEEPDRGDVVAREPVGRQPGNPRVTEIRQAAAGHQQIIAERLLELAGVPPDRIETSTTG